MASLAEDLKSRLGAPRQGYTITTQRRTGSLGGSGSSTGSVAGVGDALSKMQQQSRDENQARLDKVMELLGRFGTSALGQADRTTGRLQASAQQGLMNRGLGNTTVLNNVQQGIAREGDLAKSEILERQALMQANVLQGVSNPYPDLGLYAQLLMQPGALGGGGVRSVGRIV